MKILLLTFGVPASGKSSWVKNNGLFEYSLNPDLIRLQFQSPILTPDGNQAISGKNDKMVWGHLMSLLEARMERGEFTVVEGTHSKPSDFAKYKDLIEKYRYKLYTVDFSDVPLEVLKQRNAARDSYAFVPENVIENLHSRVTNLRPPSYANLISRDAVLEKIKYKPLNYNHWKNIYICSDIHGCFEPLQQFLDIYKPTEQDLLVVNGDFFDRGLQTKEVLKFWVEWHNRPNFVYIDSNHHTHFRKYAYEQEHLIKSKEFLYNTLPDIQKAEAEFKYERGLFRNLCRKTAQCLLFEYHGRNWLVNHGGIPFIPTKGLEFVAANEMVSGVGKYEDDLKVVESWNRLMPENYYQCFGHRRINNPDYINGRVYTTEGKVEFGGELRFVHLAGDQINVFGIKNNIFRSPEITVSAAPVVIPESQTDIKEFVDFLRTKKKEVYESKFDNISTFCFKKSAFYDNLYQNVKELPRGFFINEIGEVVARGMLKCYNFGEIEANQPETLRGNLTFPVKAYLKYNGFLGLLGYDSQKDELVFTSKSTIKGDYAEMFETIFRQKYNYIVPKLKEYLKINNLCLTFEVLTPKDPHIVDIEEEKIVLLDVYSRTIETIKHDNLLEFFGQEFGFETKKLVETFFKWSDLDIFLRQWDSDIDKTYDGKFIEGFVIEDSNGYIFKIKSRFYRKWKFFRSLKDQVAGGRRVNLAALNTPLDNEFYAFLLKIDRDLLKISDIISLRKQFYGKT